MIKVAIYGYGNLGKGVELAVEKNPDMENAGIFTRRAPESVKTLLGTKVYSADDILNYKDRIDVLVICGGSATDLPEMTPALSENFNVVDSFDTHADIPAHFEKVDAIAKNAKTTALISAGWDPGMFSVSRVYASAILPDCKQYTFWGKGVSQGHSDAIRRIKGVADARQYTVPIEEAVESVRKGENPTLTAGEKHRRDCYVVLAEGADKEYVENAIKTMPKYFADYPTTVNFISQEELDKYHKGLPHGGSVISSGTTGKNNENSHTIEYKLNLDSNSEFTASVLACCARAVYKLANRGEYGCKTILDIAPAELSALSGAELREKML